MFETGDEVLAVDAFGFEEPGLVLYTERKNEYDHCIIVLINEKDIETYRRDGTRYASKAHIRKG